MKRVLKLLSYFLVLFIGFPVSVLAGKNDFQDNDFVCVEQDEFEKILMEIQDILSLHPEYTEDMVLAVMDEQYRGVEKGVIEIWNMLTDSEKKLCICYPFDALKVNKAKNIAFAQTEVKFGINGLGDRSDAFRHGIWNAEMTVLIGKEKAELFATAHEDNLVTGNESDGYPKTLHRDMDLHNNEVGREIGELHVEVSEEEMGDIVYQEVYSAKTKFIWIHE